MYTKYKIKKLSILAATLITATVSAASVDFRQEYRNEQNNQDQYQSRVKFGGTYNTLATYF